MLNILANIVFIIVGIFFILGILAVRGTWYVWLCFLSIFTITLQLTNTIEIISSILLWIIIVIGLVFSQKNIRQKLLSNILLKSLKERMPNFNDIKKAIIAAVNPWFEGNILNGNLNWSTLLQVAKFELTGREQVFLSNQVEILCQMLNDSDSTQNKLHLSPQIWEYLKQHKFLSMTIPLEYGGLGFSYVAVSEIIQKIATRSISTAMNIMVPNSLALHELLLKHGTKLQKEEYLPQLASGYHIPAFAITSNAADEDVDLISENGIVCYGKYQDQEILGIRLNFDKSYVTLGPIATLLCVVVKLYDPNNLLVGTKKDLGSTICLIPTNFLGITCDTRYLLLNPTFMSGPVRGKNVFLPLEFIIGGKDMIGYGDFMFSNCLSVFRGMALPSLGAAIGKLIFKNITAYLVINQKVGFWTVECNVQDNDFAKIAGYTYMLESIRHFTLLAFNMGYNSGVLSAMAKCCTTKLSRKIVNIALDINGNRAGILGANNYLSRIYKSIPTMIAMNGSNTFLKSKMILQSGIVKCHPFLAAQIDALEDNNVKIFDQHFFAHVSYMLGNFAKMILHSFSNKIFCCGGVHDGINKSLKKHCKHLSFFSIVLSCFTELSFLEYGIFLKQHERLSVRLVDIWSYISMGCAVIKYHSQNVDDSDDVVFAEWCLQQCLYDIQRTIINLLENFPNKFLAKILSIIIFPFGKKYPPPNDISEHLISNIMSRNTAIRTRFISECYIASDDNLEIAFKKILNIAPYTKKIDLAEKSGVIPKSIDLDHALNMAMQEKILTELEANLIKEAELAANNAMHVNEFSINSL